MSIGTDGVGLDYEVFQSPASECWNSVNVPVAVRQVGAYEIDFIGKFTSTGVYFYRMTVTDDKSNQVYTDTKKMLMIK